MSRLEVGHNIETVASLKERLSNKERQLKVMVESLRQLRREYVPNGNLGKDIDAIIAIAKVK